MSAQDIGKTILTNRYKWLYRAVPEADRQVQANDNKSLERVIKSIIILGAIMLFFIVSKDIDDVEKQHNQIVQKVNNNMRYQNIEQVDRLIQDEQQYAKSVRINKESEQKQGDKVEKQDKIAQTGSTSFKNIKLKEQEPVKIKQQVNAEQQANNQQPTPPLVANIHPMALNIKMQKPVPYFTLAHSSQSHVYKQLPMCIISMNINDQRMLQQIPKSIDGYKNYRHYYTGQYIDHAKSINIQVNKSSYCLQLRQAVEKYCKRGDIVVLADTPLQYGILSRISYLYQTQNVWLTYQDRNEQQVHSLSTFYSQLLLRVSQQYLLQYSNEKQQLRALAKSMYLLAQFKAYDLSRQSVYATNYYQKQAQAQIHNQTQVQKPAQTQEQSLAYFIGRIDPFLQAQPTMASISLSQYGFESRYNIYYYQTYVQKYKPTEQANKRRVRKQRNNITKSQMEMAIQFIQLKQLPSEHVLAQLQKEYYNSKYDMSQYAAEVQLCVVVPSYNNVQHGRHRRVIDSILQQDYDIGKYHVVFVDDYSDDGTYELTRQHVEQAKHELGDKIHRNLSQVRIDYIRNTQRKYSTYNIYNAVTNYCNQREVAVIVDGDDQLIGRQVFSLINYAYSTQNKQYWVVYFSHMSSDFGYGTSKYPNNQYIGNQYSPRIPYHAFGALRTFSVKLYNKIKLQDHKDMDGNFWTTIYDDAMQYPLFEMAGTQHILYIPEIVYFYNRFYGNNDDSSRSKRQHRKQQKLQILRRNKYQRVDQL